MFNQVISNNKNMQSQTCCKLGLFIFIFCSVTAGAKNGTQIIIADRQQYQLKQEQQIALSASSPIKIQLVQSKYKDASKRTQHLSIKNKIKKSNNIQTNNGENIKSIRQFNKQQNITIFIKVLKGKSRFYFAPSSGFVNTNAVEDGNLKNQQIYKQQLINTITYARQDLKLKQGTNVISFKSLQKYMQDEIDGQNLLLGLFCIIVIPEQSQSCQFIIKYGGTDSEVFTIELDHPISIHRSNNQLSNKAYLIKTNQYNVNLLVKRKKNISTIYVYECPHKINKFFINTNFVLSKFMNKNQKQNKLYSSSQEYLKAQLQTLSKYQQLKLDKCTNCQLYLVISPFQSQESEVQVILQLSKSILKLSENQIINQQINSKQTKKYLMENIKLTNKLKQAIKLTIQVYEGQISVTIKSETGDWVYSPMKYSGIISIQVPIPDNKKQQMKQLHNYSVQISALNQKDATYSLVYSLGPYQIYIKDGYPTSHLLKPKQLITFFYENQNPSDSPFFLSFNLKNPRSLQSLHMKIYIYEPKNVLKQQGQKTKQKSAKKQLNWLVRPASKFAQQAKSFVVQIPGNCSKAQFVFQNRWQQQIQLMATIHDEQIVFLPLNHSLTLQIQKNRDTNLLISNNQQGFIQLIVKKCDESSPKIAYSLSPQDFIKQIYEYQSLGDNQRVTKNNIKIKKDQGLYVKISGDEMSNSFIQVTARYSDLNKKKAYNTKSIKKGEYGQINYQLITNSKAEIWFQQLQCSKQCQQSTKYQCYWSTSKSDLFRHMICPGLFSLSNKNTELQNIKTDGYKIDAKPGIDGIVSFKQILTDSIIYMSVKATNQASDVELIYKDIQIVTISGQISRLSLQFMFISIGIGVVVTTLLFFIIRRQARLGYQAVSTSQNLRKKKTKLQLIKS